MAAAIPQRGSSASDLATDEQGLLSPEFGQDLDNDIQHARLDPSLRVSGRIRWINFILGAAVLLPWNGKIFWNCWQDIIVTDL
jgi:hypothetical protein